MDVTVNWQSLDIKNNGIFYTDANAYKMVKREKDPVLRKTYPINNPQNKVPQVAANMYPINSGIMIEDPLGKEQMIVMNDRSQAGSAY